ncbi:MAG: glycosyltransferase, partial [Gemmatimonadota bacterium]|nr:glycosyltransferase [Gemmatimonadota bacterium]
MSTSDRGDAGMISVAICTRNRPEQLARALRSIREQQVPPGEVLVVDNAPADDLTRRTVEDGFPNVRYVLEEVPGLDFARNRALAEAAGEVVAFLDDDAVAAPDWTAEMAAVFREGARIAICTGRVDALALETEGQRLFEANGGFARGDRRIHLPADRGRIPLIAWSIGIGSGCSLAVRRDTILKLGGFDEALDMGPALPGGGDLDILWRVLDAGLEVVYAPTVRALHEHRRDADAAVAQIVEHNRSLIAVLTKALWSAPSTGHATIVAFLLWRLAKPGLRLAKRAAGRDPLPASALLRLWWGCWRGLGTYP